MTDPYARLRELAAAATPGPWSEDDGNVFSDPVGEERDAAIMRRVEGDKTVPHPDEGRHLPVHFVCTTTQESDNFDANAAYIAAANPAVVARLLAERDQWHEAAETHRRYLAYWTSWACEVVYELGGHPDGGELGDGPARSCIYESLAHFKRMAEAAERKLNPSDLPYREALAEKLTTISELERERDEASVADYIAAASPDVVARLLRERDLVRDAAKQLRDAVMQVVHALPEGTVLPAELVFATHCVTAALKETDHG